VLCVHAHVAQLPPSSRSGDNWIARGYTNAIQSQHNFELQLYITATQQAAAGSPLPPSMLMRATFRCAANTGLDNNMLPIGIPNFLPNEDDGARSFYFATLRDVPSVSGRPSLQLQREPSDSSSAAGAAGNGAAVRQRRDGGAQRGAQFSLMATNTDPMPDIKLGPLLGKGAFGRVYRGETPTLQHSVGCAGLLCICALRIHMYTPCTRCQERHQPLEQPPAEAP
jgi:hypothetical protein